MKTEYHWERAETSAHKYILSFKHLKALKY